MGFHLIDEIHCTGGIWFCNIEKKKYQVDSAATQGTLLLPGSRSMAWDRDRQEAVRKDHRLSPCLLLVEPSGKQNGSESQPQDHKRRAQKFRIQETVAF